MELTFCWHIDADGDVERALLYGKGEEAARISQRVEAGNRIIESWVLRSHGRILDQAGVIGSAQLSAEYLEELPDIVRQVEEATKARMMVGVGKETAEAVVARRIAEERGGDPAIVLYTPDLSEEARQLDEMSDEEAEALDGQPDMVGGADAMAPGEGGGAALGKAEDNQREGGEATQIKRGQVSPTAAAPSAPPSPSFSLNPAGDGQKQPPPQSPQGAQSEPTEDDVLQAVGQTLQEFKQQLPFFEQQVKTANPQAYKAVMEMVQGMIAMAQQLAGGSDQAEPPPGAGQQMQKSEVERREKEERAKDTRTTHCSLCGNPVDVAEDRSPKPHARMNNRTGKRAPCHGTTVVTLSKGEGTKVELDPNRPTPPAEELRKLYDVVSSGNMAMAEATATDQGFREFVTGFHHERREHPHLDDNEAALTAVQHLREDPQYYSKLKGLEESGVIGEGSRPLDKAATPASHHHVVLPPGSVGVGGRARSVKVVEPVSGKASWHQVSTGQKLSGDGHSLSTRVAECPSADTPEKRAADAGLVGAPTTAQEEPPQTAKPAGK